METLDLVTTHTEGDKTQRRAMKFATALLGAGALCAADAFVSNVRVASSFGQAAVTSRAAVESAPVSRSSNDVVMLLGGGSKRAGGIPKTVSSKIASIFRAAKGSKG